MYYIFVVKNPILILDQVFHRHKVSEYDVIRRFANSFSFVFCSKNSSNDIVSGTLTVKKLIKMRNFTIKIYYISSQNDPNIAHVYQKLYLGLVAVKFPRVFLTFFLQATVLQ
jgi:hypothetical protein